MCVLLKRGPSKGIPFRFEAADDFYRKESLIASSEERNGRSTLHPPAKRPGLTFNYFISFQTIPWHVRGLKKLSFFVIKKPSRSLTIERLVPKNFCMTSCETILDRLTPRVIFFRTVSHVKLSISSPSNDGRDGNSEGRFCGDNANRLLEGGFLSDVCSLVERENMLQFLMGGEIGRWRFFWVCLFFRGAIREEKGRAVSRFWGIRWRNVSASGSKEEEW